MSTTFVNLFVNLNEVSLLFKYNQWNFQFFFSITPVSYTHLLQFVLRTYLSQFTDSKIIVNLDIGGYHRNRVKQLEILATKTAKEVAKTKIAVKLDPMNSYERRVIHTKLADWKDVETISEGEGQDRSLIIKPKKK